MICLHQIPNMVKVYTKIIYYIAAHYQTLRQVVCFDFKQEQVTYISSVKTEVSWSLNSYTQQQSSS